MKRDIDTKTLLEHVRSSDAYSDEAKGVISALCGELDRLEQVKGLDALAIIRSFAGPPSRSYIRVRETSEELKPSIEIHVTNHDRDAPFFVFVCEPRDPRGPRHESLERAASILMEEVRRLEAGGDPADGSTPKESEYMRKLMRGDYETFVDDRDREGDHE